MYKYMRIALCALIVFLAGIWTAGHAYGLETTEATEAISSEERLARIAASRRLKITATPDDEAWSVIPLGDPEKMGVDRIIYRGVTDVQIDIAGQSKKLETAILDGDISVPELICYVQMDALGGVCREMAWSRNGLAYYTYRYYPEYDIEICHDIYETPDGKQHKINSFNIYGIGHQVFSYYEDESSPVGDYIDREDWGITLDVASVSPEGIVLICDQQGGQQVGQLVTSYYRICRGRIDGDRQDIGPDDFSDCKLEVQISGNARTEICIDWQDPMGSLPSGEYCLRLFIDDQYDREQLHPLIRKYHDGQAYWIDFTIS